MPSSMPSLGKRLRSSFVAAPMPATTSRHEAQHAQDDDQGRDSIFSDLIAQHNPGPLFSNGERAMQIGLTESAVFVPFVNDQLHRRYYEGSAALARAEAAEAEANTSVGDGDDDDDVDEETVNDPSSGALAEEGPAEGDADELTDTDDRDAAVDPAASTSSFGHSQVSELPLHHPADTDYRATVTTQAEGASLLLLRGHFKIKKGSSGIPLRGRVEFKLVCRRRISRSASVQNITSIPGSVEIGLPSYPGVQHDQNEESTQVIEHFELLLPPSMPLSVKASNGCIVGWRLFASFIPEDASQPTLQTYSAPILVVRLPPLASAAPLSALRSRSTLKWDYEIELPDRVVCIGAGVINVNLNFKSKLERSQRNPDGIVVLESARLILKQSILTFDESEGKIRVANEDIELIPVGAIQKPSHVRTAWPFPTILDNAHRQKLSTRLSFASPMCRSEITPTYTPKMSGTAAPSRVKHPDAKEPISIHHSLALHVVLATPGFLHRLRMAAGVWVGSCGLLPPKEGNAGGLLTRALGPPVRSLGGAEQTVYSGTTDLPRYDTVLQENGSLPLLTSPEAMHNDDLTPAGQVTGLPRSVSPTQVETESGIDPSTTPVRSKAHSRRLAMSTPHRCHCPPAAKNSYIRRGSEGTLYGLSDTALGKKQTLQNLSPIAAGVMYSQGRSRASFSEPGSVSTFNIPLFGSRRFSGTSVVPMPWQESFASQFRHPDESIVGSVWTGASVRRATRGPVSLGNGQRGPRTLSPLRDESAGFNDGLDPLDSSDPVRGYPNSTPHDAMENDNSTPRSLSSGNSQRKRWLSRLTANFANRNSTSNLPERQITG